MSTPVDFAATQLHLASTLGAVFLGNIMAAMYLSPVCYQCHHRFTELTASYVASSERGLCKHTHTSMVARIGCGSECWYASVPGMFPPAADTDCEADIQRMVRSLPEGRMFVPNHSRAIRRVVDAVHTALMTYSVYFYAVSNFGDPYQLGVFTWSLKVGSDGSNEHQYLVNTEVDTYSECLVFAHMCCSIYASRLWLISRSKWLMALVWIVYSAFCGLVAVEAVLAVSLSVFLWRSRTGFRYTDNLIRAIITYSVRPGILNSLCAVMILIAYTSMPTNYIYVAFFFLLPKFSLNSLLALLNARTRIRKDARRDGVMNVSLSGTRGALDAASSGETTLQSIAIQGKTTTDKEAGSTSHVPPMPQDLNSSRGIFEVTKEDAIRIV
ncbi:hypothetical protein NM688_g5483 [Phlebia brevispora]|uniref:Uncharacterized protein n=1 Tax=Phlebia brevispora TaxID=194682 RepID=A0ACC1SUQ9_9APHY|nr:hypothetical protein NM688_g5483 [Phlebia brevispora]